MKLRQNNKGVALVTALVLTLVALVVILGILYMVSQGASSGGKRKVYTNAVEASYGASDVTLLEVLPYIINSLPQTLFDTTTGDMLTADTLVTNATLNNLETRLSDIDLEIKTSASAATRNRCIADKLTKTSGANWVNWTNCPSNDSNPRNNPDVTFTLKGTQSNYKIYSKIVDTIPGTPYPAARELDGGTIPSYGRHFVFRIEVAADRTSGTGEQGRLTVVYEY